MKILRKITTSFTLLIGLLLYVPLHALADVTITVTAIQLSTADAGNFEKMREQCIPRYPFVKTFSVTMLKSIVNNLKARSLRSLKTQRKWVCIMTRNLRMNFIKI